MKALGNLSRDERDKEGVGAGKDKVAEINQPDIVRQTGIDQDKGINQRDACEHKLAIEVPVAADHLKSSINTLTFRLTDGRNTINMPRNVDNATTPPLYTSELPLEGDTSSHSVCM